MASKTVASLDMTLAWGCIPVHATTLPVTQQVPHALFYLTLWVLMGTLADSSYTTNLCLKVTNFSPARLVEE